MKGGGVGGWRSSGRRGARFPVVSWRDSGMGRALGMLGWWLKLMTWQTYVYRHLIGVDSGIYVHTHSFVRVL